MVVPVGPELRRQYVKLCDVEDFDDAALRARIREIVPGHEPRAELRRKFWEYAMLTLFLEDVGRLTDETQVLSVGAGHEEVLFWLANRVRRIVATDIYGEGGFREAEAVGTMLSDPAAFAPYPYREDRLEVAWMDARALEIPDESFDAVFSLSSIEHFGSGPDVAAAARELGRVLKPRGHAFVVTECFVQRNPLNSPLVQTAIRVASLGRLLPSATPRRRAIDVFTAREIADRILAPSGLALVQRPSWGVSERTWQNVIRKRGAGRLESATGDPWPHVLLQHEAQVGPIKLRGGAFTSIALALQKPAR